MRLIDRLHEDSELAIQITDWKIDDDDNVEAVVPGCRRPSGAAD